jgi:hypothetical protein
MKKLTILLLLCTSIAAAVFQAEGQTAQGEKQGMKFQEEKIDLIGGALTVADYFQGKSTRSVVLAPGAMFSKESYHSLADRFQKLGINALCLNSGATPDLLNSIAFLKARGTEKITVLGASAGGAGVLFTLDEAIDPIIDSAILLAPAGGLPIKSRKIRKLFIVAEDDMISSNAEVYRLFMDSADPKVYEEIAGASEHAQRLFDSKHKEDIIQMIIKFMED